MDTTTSSSSIKLLKFVKLGYTYVVNNFLGFILIPFIAKLLFDIVRVGPKTLVKSVLDFDIIQVLCCLSLVIIFVVTVYFRSKSRPVYLVDFALFKPIKHYRIPFSSFREHLGLILKDNEKVDFQMRILERSGLGEETCLPKAIHYLPPRPTLDDARVESETVIFSAIDSLLKKTGVAPEEIGILVVNCSLFYPTPSLSAMVVNKYKLRSDIKSFSLAGMGCGCSPISVQLARDLLQVHPNSYALVVSTEIITPNYYQGNTRAMLLANCLFRMGAAAMLLTNKRKEKRRSKYQLLHVVRTHTGADNDAYVAAIHEEDEDGKVGVSLKKNITTKAGEAVKLNIRTMGPLVLPLSEQLLYVYSFIARKLFKSKQKPYIPDFKKAFEHFCIHAGGRAVIDELEMNLELSKEHCEASRMALHRFGNTSSSTIWYELSYTESKGRVKKGDRVWQIGFGSGFKCNSAVWKCNRTIKTHGDGPWDDCINRYPVLVPERLKF